MTMTRVMRVALCALGLSVAACSSVKDEHAAECPSAISASAVQVENGIGALSGALMLPPGCGPFPALLIIAGSGPTDRNGNQLSAGLHTDTYFKIAEALAAQGIASVRFDKAGVGGSVGAAPKEIDLRVEDEAADAALWVDWLRADPRFDAVIVAGHSEGALLGLLVDESKAIDGYVSLEGAGRPIDQLLRAQLARNSGLTADLVNTANSILDELLRGRIVTNVPQELAPLFRAEVQPYLISWMRYDPAAEFAKNTVPALVIQGTTDTQVSLADAELLMKARPDARELIVEEMNHVLKPATLENESQARAYTDPSLPVRSEVIDALRILVNDVSPAQA
jgi:fermentation-respiration switch protein FrsA (DUF1100 family)